MNKLGSIIQERRKSRGLTQEDLAEMAKVNLRTIQRIENNENTPRGKTLVLICDALDLDLEEILLSGNDENMVFGYTLGSRGKRLAGHLLEGAIYLTIFILPTLYLIITSTVEGKKYEPLGFLNSYIIGVIFYLLVGAVFYPLFSGNLGHRIFGLKVISSESGTDYNKSADGAIREFLKYMTYTFIIPIIWLLWDDKKQNLYDKLTKTYVVEKN